ncbi:GldG family protein [Chloroflexota bacterium]
MQTERKVYSYSGLIAVLGLVALLVGLIVTVVLPEIQSAAWGILALGVILLATAFIIDFRRVSSAIAGRRGRFGAGTTVMASIFVGVVLLANAISIGNYHRFDLTGVAQFTLTSQTKEALGKLETPVDVLFFYGVSGELDILLRGYAENLLSEYQNYTDQLSIEFIDTDEYPERARQYGITQYGTAVFESENQHRLVWPQEIVVIEGQEIVAVEAEHAFTSAILEVTGAVQKKVYFLTGHGESSINTDYSYAKEGLLDNLYKIGVLDLLFTRSIPEDCTALIIAAPQESINESEIEIIENYLENDGWVMILTNPDSPQEIKQLLSTQGVDIKDGTVIDPSSYAAPNIDSPSVTRIRNQFGLGTTYFPGSTAIIPQEEKEAIGILPLVWTSTDSWLERDFNPGEEPAFNEGVDTKGPLALGVLIYAAQPDATKAASPEVPDTRLIVIGDSDFVSNQHFYNGNNGEFFLNSVNLLTQGKELISIERKVLPFRRLVISPQEMNLIRYSSIALLPLLVLVAGGIIWWRRR